MKYTKYAFIFLAGVVLVLLIVPLVFADDDDHPGQGGGHHDGGGGVVDVGVSTELSSVTSFESNNRAYGLSGGDMDINDCLATESYLFGLYQRTKPNYLCMAREAQALGEYDRAAELRCAYWGVRRNQGGKKSCIENMRFENLPLVVEIIQSPMIEDDDEGQRELDYMQAQIAELEQQIEQRPAPQRMYIDQGAERRAAAKAALQGEKQ